MSDYFENEVINEGPEEIVTRTFSRCQNYPKERIGVIGLAQGLKKSADRFSVPMERIVAACVEASTYCPTDADLINVARIIRDDLRRAEQPDKQAEWKQQYGAPAPFEWNKIDTAKVKRVKDRERKMYSAIKAKYPGELSWHGMIAAARELGYDDYADNWERGMVR